MEKQILYEVSYTWYSLLNLFSQSLRLLVLWRKITSPFVHKYLPFIIVVTSSYVLVTQCTSEILLKLEITIFDVDPK